MLLHEYIARSLPNDVYLANRYGDEYIDDRLCDYVYRAMKEKLALARDKGRGGWYREDCKIDDLKKMLIEHIDKGDMIDVINFAAMIYAKKLMAETLVSSLPSLGKENPLTKNLAVYLLYCNREESNGTCHVQRICKINYNEAVETIKHGIELGVLMNDPDKEYLHRVVN